MLLKKPFWWLRKSLFGAIIFCGPILFLSCQTGHESLIDHGQLELHSPGYPGFYLTAFNHLDISGNDSVEVEIEIPHKNLFFRKASDDLYSARFTKRILIERQSESDSDRYSTAYNDVAEDTLFRESYDSTTSRETYIFNRHYTLEPGKYRIRAMVTDNTTDTDYSRYTEVEVPHLPSKELAFGQLRLLSLHNDERFRTEPGYHIEAGYDSLKSSIQLFVDTEAERAQFDMRLLKFNYDNEPARPPHLYTPMQGSLAYRGIDYREPDTLQTVSRELTDLDGVLDIEFELPRLSEGNYRLEVESPDLLEEQRNEELYRARDFAVMPEHFPYISDIEKMAEALIYITRSGEHEKIMDTENPDSLRLNFESFFADLYNNRNMAKNIIQQYFNRVEEANLMFSTHKPGWKTDPGMVYILFGPPDLQERSIDGMVWYYTRDTHMQANRFFFERSRNVDRTYPAENYILQRGRQFDRDYNRIIDRWRRGVVF